MLERTAAAVQNSTLIFFMIDLRAGITAADRRFADWLRRIAPAGHVVLLANKVRGPAHISLGAKCYPTVTRRSCALLPARQRATSRKRWRTRSRRAWSSASANPS
eukprot:scaffold1466_cov249-Pinguiococcus_pyrenoidosus.AAC.6